MVMSVLAETFKNDEFLKIFILTFFTCFIFWGSAAWGFSLEITVVAPRVYAPCHQHHFVARLDMAVDGPDNTVEEVDVVADAGDDPRNVHRKYMATFCDDVRAAAARHENRHTWNSNWVSK